MALCSEENIRGGGLQEHPCYDVCKFSRLTIATYLLIPKLNSLANDKTILIPRVICFVAHVCRVC